MNYYILQDLVITKEPNTMKWAAWFQSADRVVEKTQVAPDVEISTVFLGLDHQFGEGPPLLFETMIFGGIHDGETWRYSTYTQALEGHKAVVAEFGKQETTSG